MSLDQTQDNPVHFPANANAFAFDGEVSKIFPNMAQRSIPNYNEGHRVHVGMLRSIFRHDAKLRVLDVGASRGQFIKELQQVFEPSNLDITAIDNSPAMCQFLRDDYASVDVIEADIAGTVLASLDGQFDVVCAYYVLQFIPTADQDRVLKALCSLVRPGGILLLGQKDQHFGHAGSLGHEQYIQFRVDNGYTRAEIEAKTKALKGSMFPMNFVDLCIGLRGYGMAEVYPTTRWMMFNTLFCIKQ